MKRVEYEKLACMHVLAWVSLLSHNKKAQRYALMQCIKESSTLRISPKKQKPSPRIVYRYGEQDEQISSFLHYRKMIRGIIRELNLIQTVFKRWSDSGHAIV